MKKVFVSLLTLLFAGSAYATTLSPIQLLNPSGSTSGQAIVSTGAGTVPAWANVSAAALTGITPVLNGGTGVTTAAAELSRIGAASVAQATTALAATGGSITGVPISGSTGSFTTLGSTGLITPASVIGIKGTSTNDSAQAGSIGEYLTNSTATTSATSNVALNATTLLLTAGDWDVQGVATYVPAAGTTLASTIQGISTTSATFGAVNTGSYTQLVSVTQGIASGQTNATPTFRLNLTASTTVYLVTQATFSGSTLTVSGVLRARRVR